MEDFQIDTAGKIEINTEQFSEHIFQFHGEYPSICYIQLTGGEPLLNSSRIDQTLETLKSLDSKVQKEVRLIYQTNGVYYKGVKSSFDSFGYYGFSSSINITYSHLSSWGRKKKKSRSRL